MNGIGIDVTEKYAFFGVNKYADAMQMDLNGNRNKRWELEPEMGKRMPGHIKHERKREKKKQQNKHLYDIYPCNQCQSVFMH